MPNSYFQFKQFRIEQGAAGMKVTTDGCLLGATVPCPTSGRVLDIGAGTGLLSLMLAQRCTLPIDAIEINADAYCQAKENIANSPWADRIHLTHTALQDYSPEHLYEQIICNPPFFAGHHKGKSANKNQALHSDTLPMKDLVEKAVELLSPKGQLWVMYPEAEMKEFTSLAIRYGLKAYLGLTITNTPKGKVFRKIQSFTPMRIPFGTYGEISIRDEFGEYSTGFTILLKDYYLNL